MSKNVGGYLRGPWWRYHSDDELKTRRCFVVAWGNIVKHPQETYTDMRRIKFVIKTGRGAGRNEKHLVCVNYGEQESAVIMRAMELGDIVLCFGTWIETVSKTKKGTKPTYEMKVNFIIPQGLILFLLKLYSSGGVQQIVDAYDNADADVWESD